MIRTVPADIPPFANECPARVVVGAGFTAPYPTLPCYLPRGHEGPHRMGVERTSPKWVVLIWKPAYDGGSGIPVPWGPFESLEEAHAWAVGKHDGAHSAVQPLAGPESFAAHEQAEEAG